jgi:streptomycin 6-kinase
MTIVSIPDEFDQRVRSTFGSAGSDWLERLPGILRSIEQRWSLTLQAPFQPLSYNYVASAHRKDGSSVVMKAGVPNPELTSEVEALRHYGGNGAVFLLEASPEEGLLLLERLQPGVPVLQLDDDRKATSIAIQVMRQLWKPALPENHFRCIADWAMGFQRLYGTFDGGTGPFPAQMVARAENLYQELIASSQPGVVLHGDLHHWNILSAQRQPWLAIDPKGILGEPAYEVGAWLRNPFPFLNNFTDAQKITDRRLHQFSDELGFDRNRVRDWAFAQAVLSAWWGYEDGDENWQAMLELADLFR